MPDRSPDPGPEPEPVAGPESGARRLWAGLTGRPSRTQISVAILLAVLGFGAVVQLRATANDTAYAGVQRGDLVQLLDSLGAANQRAQNQIAQLQRTQTGLQSSTDRNRTALAQARHEASTLAILDGTVAVQGPGIVITINDPQAAIGAATLLNAVEELRDAGAEAIAINNTARVVAQTYFSDGSGSIDVDGRTLKPPYVIEAIGSAHTLSEAVVFPGGLSAEVSALGGSVSVSTPDQVIIRALAMVRSPQYAQPAS